MTPRRLGLRGRVRRTRLSRAIRRWSSLVLPYRELRTTPAKLDSEYADGQWEYLRGLSELGRFSVVAGYCHHLKPHGRLLELGCGEGVLHERLDADRYRRYVGVDVAAEAIRRASARADSRSTFVCADIATYDVDHTFDVVIFNEVLEYFRDPLAVVRRYEPALAPSGVLIVSLFAGVDTARSRRIWHQLDAAFEVVDATHVTNDSAFSWTIKVLRPPADRSAAGAQS